MNLFFIPTYTHTLHTVINLEFDDHDYRVREGSNNNLLSVVVKNVFDRGMLAHPLQLKITPLTFQQQEALGIPLPPDFPPKPVAASGMVQPYNYLK